MPTEEHFRLEEHFDLADALHHVRLPEMYNLVHGLDKVQWQAPLQ